MLKGFMNNKIERKKEEKLEGMLGKEKKEERKERVGHNERKRVRTFL